MHTQFKSLVFNVYFLRWESFSEHWKNLSSITILYDEVVVIIIKKNSKTVICPVCWGCRIHRMLLCRPSPNECPGYDKLSDVEVPVMLELWGMQSTPSLPSLPGPLWPGVVAPDKGPIYGLNRINSWFRVYWFLHLNCVFMLNWTAWNRTVLTSKLCTYAKLNYLK